MRIEREITSQKMKKSKSYSGTKRTNSQKHAVKRGLLLGSLLLCDGASAFTIQQRTVLSIRSHTVALRASPEEEISSVLERARKVLAKSKAKLEQEENKLEATGDATPVEIPFFATSASMDSSTKRERVTKTRDEETGLVTLDGEKMARLSEIEQWEMRPLGEVFENEIKDSQDSSKQLAERDVAASIFNLRKQMKTEDYRRIFDTRNRFIGEDT